MFIRSLNLKNIRSYEQQTITFSSGTTLLSGDIGSGKTTILIAIEFALFGILRGKTSPGELLRHDAKEGYVELECDLQGKHVKIRRGLKRSGDNINQTQGTLWVNDDAQELMPTELKAKILTLLGYPESLINKSTNLFRYTVYTPQEQVKIILNETPEERKDIVRKIFNIDKYNIVSSNAGYYVSDVRERVERLRGQTDDLKTLREQLGAQQREVAKINNQLPSLTQDVEESSLQRKRAEDNLKKFSEAKEKQSKEKQKLILLQKDLSNKKDYCKRIEIEREKKEQLVTQFNERLKLSPQQEIDPNRKQKLSDLLSKLAQKKNALSEKKGELAASTKQAQELISQISHLENCPTCKQEVSQEHKKSITSEQEKSLSQIALRQQKYAEFQVQLDEKERELRKKYDFVLEQEKKHALFVQQQKQHEQVLKDVDQLKEQQRVAQDELKKILELISSQEQCVAQLPVIDDKKEQDALVLARKDEREKELLLKELQTKRSVALETMQTIEKAIVEKEKITVQISTLTSLRNWMQELFVPLVQTIEKRVLLKVYQEFNDYFKSWFGMLIPDESLVVRLDEDFTPLIEQHGFDTNVTNLSGGEKTSVALSYRLALNKVLNNYFGSLHTKEVLILDEPTDGFSTEQIDNLRDVLDQVGVKQLIIVSHEQKLESLANHIIRVEKHQQISTITSR